MDCTHRKLKIRQPDGSLDNIHVDEFVDELLHRDIFLETVLPKIAKRHVLEETEDFPLRVSVLDGEIKFEESSERQENTDLFDGKSSEKPRKKIKLGEGGKNPQKEPAPESIEYWNIIRKNLGLPPLKENN